MRKEEKGQKEKINDKNNSSTQAIDKKSVNKVTTKTAKESNKDEKKEKKVVKKIQKTSSKNLKEKEDKLDITKQQNDAKTLNKEEIKSKKEPETAKNSRELKGKSKTEKTNKRLKEEPKKITHKEVKDKKTRIDAVIDEIEEKEEQNKLIKNEDLEINNEKLETIKNEIKNTKDKLKNNPNINKIRKNILRNLLIAIIVTIYFIFINLGVTTIPATEYILDLKTFTLFTAVISVVIFEKAYKKDENYLALHGIEMTFVGIATLVLLQFYSVESIYFPTVLLRYNLRNNFILFNKIAFNIYKSENKK